MAPKYNGQYPLMLMFVQQNLLSMVVFGKSAYSRLDNCFVPSLGLFLLLALWPHL